MNTNELETRVEHLEQLNHWYMNSMNTLILMSEVNGKQEDVRNIDLILDTAESSILQVQTFERIFFFLVNEGEFAWAISQNRALEIDSQFTNQKILINDILDLSKVEANKLTINNEHFNHLEGDPHRLKQILTNLLSNAIKFSDHGIITLKVTQSLDKHKKIATTHFSLSDQGIGMTEAQIDKLLQSFSQVDSSQTRKYSGTGLGLAISKQLAHLMGGNISVNSEYGVGSTFILQLPSKIINSDPVKTDYKNIQKQALIEEKLTLIKGKQVLLVEDNRVNQMVATGILKQFGLVVTIAENGKVAVETIKDHPY